MKHESYATTICTKPLPDKTLEELIHGIRLDTGELKWRRYCATGLLSKLKPILNKKAASISVQDMLKIKKSMTRPTFLQKQTILRYILKRASGDIPFPEKEKIKAPSTEIASDSTENKVVKIKHFTVPQDEIEILLRQRNSRFASLLKDVREQLLILPKGETHGFYPGTEDKKEINAMMTSMHSILKELGFVARHIKSENAIFLIRKQIVNPKNGKVIKNGN